MTTVDKMRARAGLALTRLLASASGRQQLREMGHEPGQPIVVVLGSDTVGYLYRRIVSSEAASPATIAYFAPERDRVDFVRIVSVPGGVDEADPHLIHEDSTLVAVLEYMRSTGRAELPFNLVWGAGVVQGPANHERETHELPA